MTEFVRGATVVFREPWWRRAWSWLLHVTHIRRWTVLTVVDFDLENGVVTFRSDRR